MRSDRSGATAARRDGRVRTRLCSNEKPFIKRIGKVKCIESMISRLHKLMCAGRHRTVSQDETWGSVAREDSRRRWCIDLQVAAGYATALLGRGLLDRHPVGFVAVGNDVYYLECADGRKANERLRTVPLWRER